MNTGLGIVFLREMLPFVSEGRPRPVASRERSCGLDQQVAFAAAEGAIGGRRTSQVSSSFWGLHDLAGVPW